MRHGMRVFALTILVLFGTSVLTAQDDVLTVKQLFDITRVYETAVSPDGQHVAYTMIVPRPFTDDPGSSYIELYIYDVRSGKSTRYVGGKKSLFSIHWSARGGTLYFLAALDGGTRQVWAIELGGGEAYPVTSHAESVLGYSVSSDDTELAFIALEDEDAAVKAMRSKGFTQQVYEEEQRDRTLYLMDMKRGNVKRLSRDVSVFSVAWSPDSRYIAATVAKENLVDHQYMFRRIHLVDPRSGTMRLFIDNPGKLGDLRWSPDSKHLAFISAVDVHDSKEGSIFVAPVPEGGAFSSLRNYNKNFEGTVTDLMWKDASTLLFVSEEGVHSTLRSIGLNHEKSTVLVEAGTAAFTSASAAAGLVAFSGSTAQHPYELFTYSLGSDKVTRASTTNTWMNSLRLARQEEFRYEASDGLEITSVLIYPLDYEPGKRYPLIVDIHGGPESCYLNGWVTGYGNWGQLAAARGYFVFMPNYRSSTGRGVAFLREGHGDLAGTEFDDVIDGIDALADKGYIDRRRVGIGGGSYGGYFAAWGATRFSDRFAASVVFVGVSNQISKRNNTDIPYEDYYVHWGIWTHEDWEKIYDRSPVKWVGNSKTPTLILHGTEDPRVHPSQSLELYRTLKLHGKAPVRLIWYPGEGHGNRLNPARLDYALRTMQWFDYYLKEQGPAGEMPPKYLDYPLD